MVDQFVVVELVAFCHVITPVASVKDSEVPVPEQIKSLAALIVPTATVVIVYWTGIVYTDEQAPLVILALKYKFVEMPVTK